MSLLMELQGLQVISSNAGDWNGIITDDLADAIEERISQLLSAIRPDAVALVDGFGFSDGQLNSTLGRADGNVYEAIYDVARSNPLNKSSVMAGWEDLGPSLVSRDLLSHPPPVACPV
jgi:hypothetical protein